MESHTGESHCNPGM